MKIERATISDIGDKYSKRIIDKINRAIAMLNSINYTDFNEGDKNESRKKSS